MRLILKSSKKPWKKKKALLRGTSSSPKKSTIGTFREKKHGVRVRGGEKGFR